MEEREYLSIYALEERHWWFTGLKALVSDSIDRAFKGRTGLTVLDAGCGPGGLLKRLSADNSAVGVDYSGIALGLCTKRGLKRLINASVTALPFRDSVFDLTVSLDVIYHSGVKDDVEALREFSRVLKKGGALILNLPAYEFLRSPHDRVQHTERRYTSGDLRKKLELAGFIVEKMTYRNTFLFPAVLLVRMFKRLFEKEGGQAASDLKEVSPAVNGLLKMLLWAENTALRFVNMPFGTSVFCVARKP